MMFGDPAAGMQSRRLLGATNSTYVEPSSIGIPTAVVGVTFGAPLIDVPNSHRIKFVGSSFVILYARFVLPAPVTTVVTPDIDAKFVTTGGVVVIGPAVLVTSDEMGTGAARATVATNKPTKTNVSVRFMALPVRIELEQNPVNTEHARTGVNDGEL